MGAAPSAEILKMAPFRPPHGGTRQIALIPVTAECFPSAGCQLFEQLYEAHMDPYVRYYDRYDGMDLAQYRIPPITLSREELYWAYRRVSESSLYPTNEALRADVRAGRSHLIRPVPCAVVFLYDGANHIPEGSVRLRPDMDIFVKVIGGIGDSSRLTGSGRPAECPEGMRLHMFVTKSAGDHNMATITLLAAYTYHHHCLDLIGLEELPTLPGYFKTLKTNIPFLCFLREIRERTAPILQHSFTKLPMMWVDDAFIRNFIPAHEIRVMCAAFAEHYISFLDTKASQRAIKQQRRAHGSLSNNNSVAADGSPGTNNAGLSLTDGTGFLESLHADSPQMTAASGPKLPKISYIVKGYITGEESTIVAESTSPHEVYVACVESKVKQIRPSPGATSTRARLSGISLSLGPSDHLAAADVGDPTTDYDNDDIVEVTTVERGEILSFRPASNCSDGDEVGAPGEPLPTPEVGRWIVDHDIYLENVLLSLVRDECKQAREAGEDDPRWVRDEEHQCPMHDGSFYIWHFRRGGEKFYYGTVPKFANPNRRKRPTKFISSMTTDYHGISEASLPSTSIASQSLPTSSLHTPSVGLTSVISPTQFMSAYSSAVPTSFSPNSFHRPISHPQATRGWPSSTHSFVYAVSPVANVGLGGGEAQSAPQAVPPPPPQVVLMVNGQLYSQQPQNHMPPPSAAVGVAGPAVYAARNGTFPNTGLSAVNTATLVSQPRQMHGMPYAAPATLPQAQGPLATSSWLLAAAAQPPHPSSYTLVYNTSYTGDGTTFAPYGNSVGMSFIPPQ